MIVVLSCPNDTKYQLTGNVSDATCCDFNDPFITGEKWLVSGCQCKGKQRFDAYGKCVDPVNCTCCSSSEPGTVRHSGEKFKQECKSWFVSFHRYLNINDSN